MNTNENTRNATSEDIIVLGVASVETKGGGAYGEFVGEDASAGISEE